MIRHPAFPLPALCLIAAASLCGTACAADSSQTGFAVRDSAGITIIESATPAWSTGEGWTVDPRPAVEIGVVDGPEEYTLSGVSGAVRLSDGRIVIANTGTQQVRAYDAQGRFLSDVGGEGDGPREYRYLFGVFRLPGDTIVGWDDLRVRALFYSPDLEYLGATQSTRGGEAGHGGQPRVRWLLGTPGVLDDGSLIGLGFDPSAPPPPLNQIHQQQMFALRVDRAGAWTDTIGPIACCPALMVQGTSGGTGGSQMGILGFNRRAHFAVAGDRLYAAVGTAFEVEERSADGDLLRLIRAAVPPRPVTAADRARYAEQTLASARDDNARRRAQRMLDLAQYPETMPATGGLLVDRSGHIWVQHYHAPVDDAESPATWTVFDPDGSWLGEVEMPAGLRVTDTGDDYVLGTWRDDLGVQRVRQHPLRKS